MISRRSVARSLWSPILFSLRAATRSHLLSAATCLLLLTACSHYQLGTGGKLTFATLYVAPAKNESRLPQAQAILTTQVREALARDGRVALANSPQSADATLEIVIRDYHRDVASVKESDTGLARKFTLTLGVTCTLRDNRSATVYFADRPIDTRRDAFTDGGQLQSEYQSVPLLAESLAQKIARAVLDTW
jgi:hypothetical protein